MGSHVHPATIPWKIITNIWANIKAGFYRNTYLWLSLNIQLIIPKDTIYNEKPINFHSYSRSLYAVARKQKIRTLMNR